MMTQQKFNESYEAYSNIIKMANAIKDNSLQILAMSRQNDLVRKNMALNAQYRLSLHKGMENV